MAQRHSLELQESLQAQHQLEKELADAQVACVRANMHKLPRQTAAIHALPCEGADFCCCHVCMLASEASHTADVYNLYNIVHVLAGGRISSAKR
eukprot:COSAG01_NODE_221_length_21422_cov_48.284294_12_plen_94_part_00